MEEFQLALFDDAEVCAQTTTDMPADTLSGMDILSKFEAVTVENLSYISKEDQSFCDSMQREFDAAVSVMLMAKQLFQDHDMKNDFLCSSDELRELNKKLEKVIDRFIYKIARYFQQTYSVTIDLEKFRNYDHTVTYRDILDEIVQQLNGMNFAEKAHHEIINAVRNSIYNHNKVTVRSLKVSISDYLYFEEWFGKYGNRREERLLKLLKAVELFDSGSTKVRDSLAYLNESRYRDDWFEEIVVPDGLKLHSIKFYKNGKVDIRFKSHEYAMEFAREYLKYCS